MNSLKRYLIFFALICAALTIVMTTGEVNARMSQDPETDFAAIDAYVSEQVEKLNIPGFALGIVQNGQIAHLQGFGAVGSSGQPVTPQTPFFIGSVTKSFTALAVMQLVEAGKIDLDASVQTYLRWFELADKEASAKITVRHLLNQTSGLSTKQGNSLWASQQGLEQAVRGFNAIRPTQPVGTYQYCNLNFMIAGLIVEEVSGLTYAEYVTRHIFEPLEMNHSHASRGDALADGLAKEHYYMFGRVFEMKGPQAPANLPAGALIASAEDLTHYAIAQLKDGRFGDSSILSPAGITEMHDPAVSAWEDVRYAMAWNIEAVEGTQLIWHNGDDGRSHSMVALIPDGASGVVTLANASGFEQRNQVDDIAMSVVGMMNGKPPVPVSLPFLLRFLYWIVLLTPLLMILGIALAWRKRWYFGAWRVLLMAILYPAFPFFIFKMSLNQITLSSMLVFHPEIGYSLIAIAVLGIGWAAFCPAMYVMVRRARRAYATEMAVAA